ncbi:MAG: hypothetical protein RSB77_01600 [Bacilli bacterium]
MNFLKSLIISFFLLIDRIIFGFIEDVYELFMLISETGVFSQSTIQGFANRIYVFLGLIMIFQVSISLVKYIINPKDFDSDKIGGKALVKNVAFVLVAIVMVPYVFEAAFSLQRIILKDNIIGNLILGVRTWENEDEAEDFAKNGGKNMAFAAFSAFFTYNPEIASNSCINTPAYYDEAQNQWVPNEDCEKINEIKFKTYDEKGNKLETIGQYIAFAYRVRDVRALMNADLATFQYESKDGDYDLIDYKFFLSGIVGIVIVWMLLLYCLDIAVRSVKLSFLQIIAPVPIIMRIDPGKGQEKFKKWVGECVSTYLDLFTRLATIYFIIFIISSIATTGLQNVAGSRNFVETALVRIFIIIGALFFGKKLPDLLYDIIGGQKGKDSYGTGKIKKRLTNGALGMSLATPLGMAGNGWAAGRKDFNKHRANGEGILKSFARSFMDNGGIASTLGGAGAGIRAFGAGIKSPENTSATKIANKGLQGTVSRRREKENERDLGITPSTKITDYFDVKSGAANKFLDSGELKKNLREAQETAKAEGENEKDASLMKSQYETELLKNGYSTSTLEKMMQAQRPDIMKEFPDPDKGQAPILFGDGQQDASYLNYYRENHADDSNFVTSYDSYVSANGSIDSSNEGIARAQDFIQKFEPISAHSKPSYKTERQVYGNIGKLAHKVEYHKQGENRANTQVKKISEVQTKKNKPSGGN